MVGQRLAHYEINELLGSGGMGDVYRATDTKLGRSVALKFLRQDVATDPDRVARFRREAKALASLNHPHIAAIHGLEDADGRSFLVLEFVPGQTLDERILGAPLPVSDAIPIALQIIGAVETAHGHGIVHRDLKPANVKITPDGRVKVLDFGLAKVVAGDAGPARASGPEHATVTLPSTRVGVIIGTPAYMSPEQAKGLPVDKQTDIFSFGCVLFEMLTGRRAFAGDSAADAVSRVLQREPDWTLLPSSVPASIVRLLRLCLEKDPRQRRQSAGDVRVDLEGALAEPVVATVARGSRWRVAQVVLLAGLLIATTTFAAMLGLRDGSAPAPEMRLPIESPASLEPLHFALSPDGAYLVSAGSSGDGVQRLYLKAMNHAESRALPGTDGAQYPFWSPDSKSIGFFAARKLLRIDAAGGSPQALAPAASPQGGTWGNDGTILFAPTTVSPLFRVPASGGKSIAATELRSHVNHRAPSFLADSRQFLFYATSTAPEESGIYLASLDGGATTKLSSANSSAAYLPPNRLLFALQGRIVARQLDVEHGTLSGDPVTVAEAASAGMNVRFSVAATGMVAYRFGTDAPWRATWMDSAGKVVGFAEGVMNAPALSPDRRFAAYDRTVRGNRDVWLSDLVRGDATPLTRHPQIDGHPVWSPDSAMLAFESNRNGTFDIWTKVANGGEPERPVLATPANEWPLDWSRDGHFLLYQRSDENFVSSDLLALPMTGNDRTPVVVAESAFEERTGSFSPDGHWVAYETDESGRPEIVVKAFPHPTGIKRVSTDGGAAPRWSADGRKIYFVAPDGRMMAANITSSRENITIAKPGALFKTHMVPQTFTFQYAVSRDGRFLINDRDVERVSASPIWLLLNWKP
jgi:eukaryotic-like serine/threonine-protein kinase